jgi:hypothetical protein
MRDQIVKYRGGTIHSIPEEAEAAGPSIATVFPVYIAAHCDTCRSALDLGAPLGGTAAGVTGTIYSLRDIATRVVKRMEMRDDVARLNFMRELRVLKLMRQERPPSPSGDAERVVVVRMHACYVESGVGYIVMDRHTTDLFDFVLSRGSYDARAPLVAPFAEQMALALDWLHSRGLSHCDVKLENVLVAATPPPRRAVLQVVRLRECGTSRLLQDGRSPQARHPWVRAASGNSGGVFCQSRASGEGARSLGARHMHLHCDIRGVSRMGSERFEASLRRQTPVVLASPGLEPTSRRRPGCRKREVPHAHGKHVRGAISQRISLVTVHVIPPAGVGTGGTLGHFRGVFFSTYGYTKVQTYA